MPYEHGEDAASRRMPAWMRRPVASAGRIEQVAATLDGLGLHTVCRSAKCPNRGECYASGTATFLIMGSNCTRNCRFCAIESAAPLPLDAQEPQRVAEAAKRMGLSHVVVTAVTRDDLPDGGASHFVAVIEALREEMPDAAVEVLTSDFGGDAACVDTVVAAGPDIFNHNVETVPRLYSHVRPGADYARSLGVLARARETRPDVPTKSGLMVGLGEGFDEVVGVLHDLRRVGVDIVTIGQYLRPSEAHLPVKRFIEPDEFSRFGETARSFGFLGVASAPFVRSSYRAADVAAGAAER
jgi:lipoic acid synthetase